MTARAMVFSAPTPTPPPRDAETPKRQDVPAPERQGVRYDPILRELVEGMGERRHRVRRRVIEDQAPAELGAEAPAAGRPRWLLAGGVMVAGAAAVVAAMVLGRGAPAPAASSRPAGGVSAAPLASAGGEVSWM